MLVHLDHSSYHAGVAQEMTTPKPITQHDIGAAVGTVFVAAMEKTAEIGLSAKGIEIVSAGFIKPYLNRIAAGSQSRLTEVKRQYTVEAPVPVAHIQIIGIRIQGLPRFFYREKPLCIGHMDGVQYEGIQNAEDHCVGADPEREREDSSDGKAGRFEQPSPGEFQVSRHRVTPSLI